MKTTTELIDTILNCEDCYGQGIRGWVAPDGDYDFEYCECNPYKVIIDRYDMSLSDTGTLFTTAEANQPCRCYLL